MSEIKLLPCPFCGGEAERIKRGSNFPYIHGVWCIACNCRTSFEKSEEISIEKWNTRKPMEQILERLENNSFWTEPTFDIDGYRNDDSVEVVDLDKAIHIVKNELGSEYDKDWE